jgi:cyclic beta-1,2-glucan synthetase
MRGFAADVVILNREGPSYEAPLQKSLQRLVHIAADEPRTGRVYLLDWNILSPAAQAVLFSSASVVLHGHRGRLQQQLLVSGNVDEQPGERPVMLAPNDPAVPFEPVELLFSNGYGGFTRDGAEYVIELTDGNNTPAPWANVISNQRFGTILTENGLGSTWNNNSQTNRLTPWHNDPCSDPQSEVLYLCDEQTGKRWTPTALPVRGADPYRVRHGQGYSVFQHNSAGISQTLTVFVADKDPVKICRLRLKNDSWRQRVVSATYFAEWVLGTAREKQQTHIQTEFNAELGALFARQDWDETHGEQIAFLAASPKTTEYTGSRVSFFSSENSPLDRRCGAGLDPCGALRVPLTIPSGETREVVFLLGESSSVEVGPAPPNHTGRNAAAFSRRPTEPLAAVSNVELPDVGPVGDLSVWWRAGVPGSAAGFDDAAVLRSGDHAQDDSRSGVASIR